MKISSNSNPTVQNKTISSSEAAASAATKRGEKSESAKAVAAKNIDAGSAKAEISDKAREFAKVKSAAAEAPEVREDKVAELKAKIASGNYKVNAQAIADRMVDEHLFSGIG